MAEDDASREIGKADADPATHQTVDGADAEAAQSQNDTRPTLTPNMMLQTFTPEVDEGSQRGTTDPIAGASQSGIDEPGKSEDEEEPMYLGPEIDVATNGNLVTHESDETVTSQTNIEDADAPAKLENEQANEADEDHASQPETNNSDAGETQDSKDPLYIAIKEGNLEELKKLLNEEKVREARFDDDDKEEDQNKGQTLLYLAARWGQDDVVNEILMFKPDSEIKTGDNRWTVLHIAAQYGYDEIIKLLLKAEPRANIEATTKYGETPLHIAIDNGKEETVRLLLAQGSDLESRAYDAGWTALHNAAQGEDRYTIVKELLTYHPDIEAKTEDDGVTALSIAAGWNRLDVLSLLIEEGAEVTSKNKDGETPLCVAADCGHVAVVDRLLTEMDRAGIVSENKNGETALFKAVDSGQVAEVDSLLAKMDRADVVLETKNGETALYRAAENKNEEIMLRLLNHSYLAPFPEVGVSLRANPREHEAVGKLLLDQIDDEGSDARKTLEKVLHWAVLNGHEPLVEKCIDLGQDPKSWRAENEATLLHVASSEGQEKLVRDLLEKKGLDLMARTNMNVTAVHLAAANGHESVVLFFLGKLQGPDRWLKTIIDETKGKENRDAETALSFAVKRNQQHVEKLLWNELEKADFGAYPEAAHKALTWAAMLEKPGEEGILKQRFENSPHLDKEEWLGKLEKILSPAQWTTLHWAIFHGHLEVVWWLLARGGHLKRKDMTVAKRMAQEIADLKAPTAPKRDESLADAGKNEHHASQNKTSEESHNESETTQVTSGSKDPHTWIFHLLHSPPPVLGDSAHHDLHEKPILKIPSPRKEEVCRKFGATILDFYHHDNRVDFLYRADPVYNVIYGDGPEKMMSESRNPDIRQRKGLEKVVAMIKNPGGPSPEKPEPSKRPDPVTPRTPGTSKRPEDKTSKREQAGSDKPDDARSEKPQADLGEFQFRWFHVAANNMDWIEDLMIRIFRDAGKTNETHRPLSKFVRRSWIPLSAGAGRPSYMKPLCTMEPMTGKVRQARKDRERETTQPETRSEERTGLGQRPPKQARPGQQATPDVNTPRRKKPGLDPPPDEHLADRNAEKSEQNKKGPTGSESTSAKPLSPRPSSQSDDRPIDRIAIYMPYLTFSAQIMKDTEKRTDEDLPHGQALSHSSSPSKEVNTIESKAHRTESKRALDLHKELMDTYEKPCVVHESRSLDRYYYSFLPNTNYRDTHQVVTRYFDERPDAKKPRMLRVDQLWLWIIDEATIISSATHRLDDEEDPILENIINDLIEGNSKGRPPPSTVEEMGQLIMSISTGFIDQHKVEVDGNGTLESTLQIFENSINHVSDQEAELFTDFKKKVADDAKDRDEMLDNPYFYIHNETGLLQEIKDIRDELNILKSLVEDQKDVWNQAFEKLDKNGNYVGKYLQPVNPAEIIERILEMEKDAEKVQNAVNSLLDLKQKQANVLDAEAGRKQADSTAKQGNTIMVFTLVTIVFLPMSLLTSIYALDITSFPHKADNLVYTPNWVFSRIFGASAAISFPLIILAFFVNEFLKVWQKIKDWWLGKPKQTGAGDSTSPSSGQKPQEKPQKDGTKAAAKDASKKLDKPVKPRRPRRRVRSLTSALVEVFLVWWRNEPKEEADGFVEKGEKNV